MKLIVGLGNPGRKYAGSRHNVGFEVLDELARRLGVSGRRAKFRGEVAEVSLAGTPAMLLWPQTFMNLSGESVLAARDFYKLDLENLLIVCDDFHLPLETLRFRPRGSAGGQRGLENILQRLGRPERGSLDISRLRFGVGPLDPGRDAARFVLGKFSVEQAVVVAETVSVAADGVVDWARKGTDWCMNQYN